MDLGLADPGRPGSTVGPAEQVTQRLAPKQGGPAASTVLGPVVDHVAALTADDIDRSGHDAHPPPSPVTPGSGCLNRGIQ